jgi:hypothetical protein
MNWSPARADVAIVRAAAVEMINVGKRMGKLRFSVL